MIVEAEIARCLAILSRADRLLVITGAGISAESAAGSVPNNRHSVIGFASDRERIG